MCLEAVNKKSALIEMKSQAFLILITTCLTLFVTGLAPNYEIIEQGRTQYQLLKDRQTIPQYGACWKSAIEHLDTGCRLLTETTQSDIALHLTNCFLDMSGHQTYNCELDKKRNLRAICISSMSDRAFNVYTEFYTHTQNMCWFLQGQVWQEIISESTMKVGKQLKETAANQQDLLEAQKQSLELQGKMLKHGQFLEQLLEDIYASFRTHQDVLRVLSGSISKLQAWVMGEISWFDSIIFYTVVMISIFVFTASERVQSARFPVLLMLFLNLSIERLLCSTYFDNVYGQNVENYNSIYYYVWISRYGFIAVSVTFLIYRAIVHENPVMRQNQLLRQIGKQNEHILKILTMQKQPDYLNSSNLSYANEVKQQNSLVYSNDSEIKNISSAKEVFVSHENGSFDTSKMCYKTPQLEVQNKRYNLRSNTPIK